VILSGEIEKNLYRFLYNIQILYRFFSISPDKTSRYCGRRHQGTVLKNRISILPMSDPGKQAVQVIKSCSSHGSIRRLNVRFFKRAHAKNVYYHTPFLLRT
jgi:hypothetical protein